MSDSAMTATAVMNEDYIEDEFGLGLKGFLLARLVFLGLCLFMVLGALVCVFTGLTNFDVLISSATALTPSKVDQHFTGYQICMFAQGVYSVASPFLVFLFMTKRNKLFAFIDLGAFLVFIIVSIVMGAAATVINGETVSLFFNGSAWIAYLVFNPVWSFIALFVGKHFKYMPFK
ncbi:MAG: hypothetical protein NC084_03345 [Bacteroides sp.]|nr:hypothetical protein [Roseburia sp.]MCM1461732.1 hypothetical protein [Bacteroides sp.]